MQFNVALLFFLVECCTSLVLPIGTEFLLLGNLSFSLLLSFFFLYCFSGGGLGRTSHFKTMLSWKEVLSFKFSFQPFHYSFFH